MIIGILKCDTVKPELRKNFGDYNDMFQQIFHEKDPHNQLPRRKRTGYERGDKSHQGNAASRGKNIPLGFQFHVFNVIKEEYPKEIHSCDAYLITGSANSIYDKESWISNLSLFIRKLHHQQKKIIGVCFGHQLIAKALGGAAKRSEKGWGIGVMSTKIEHHENWMIPELDNFSLITSHQDQVTKLPKDAILLGSNSFCPVSMYRIGNHILSMQGHPEFTPDYAEALFKNRMSIIGGKKVQKAVDSLRKKTDHQVIVNWIIHFLLN